MTLTVPVPTLVVRRCGWRSRAFCILGVRSALDLARLQTARDVVAALPVEEDDDSEEEDEDSGEED